MWVLEAHLLPIVAGLLSSNDYPDFCSLQLNVYLANYSLFGMSFKNLQPETMSYINRQ